MGRSTKKGPFINQKLLEKIKKLNTSGEKRVIKTWARACTITPDFIGHTLGVHNGRKFLPLYVTEQHVGHKLGEFSFTRFFRSHGGTHKESASLT